MSWRYLDIADFLVIAEAALGLDPTVLGRSDHVVALAESGLAAPAASFEGIEFYPDFSRKAAVLYSHLARNHPLPDGNKRIAYLCMVEFIERNGGSLNAPNDGPELDAFVELLANVASSAVSEADFAAWIAARMSKVESSEGDS